ncbi:A/G-specific adenine glycosylase [Thiomicrospira microaerophila]|uniref:A/G-specific adenine glycosylase n=1 Tax=Thiomicrospira microaerophila TaxID=406020 RepID=UPI0005CB04E6|nr:A/G-specific adenine glycosylase [Thiomicrospira microaerophila]
MTKQNGALSRDTFLFSDVLLAWFDVHGRHDLPWQHPRTAYQVWVSEIMLQQTQVQTVIPYFIRFMAAFPTLDALARADQETVLAHWAGLGYYARGRNLHRAAQQVVALHNGVQPANYAQLLALPGIGRSTAGAILAQAHGQAFAILDGNVKRVLTRFYAIEGWPGHKHVENLLWEKAEGLLPKARLADYTQAMMDLGATLCRRTKPSCNICPLNLACQAYLKNTVAQFPTPKPKKTLPTHQAWLLITQDHAGKVALVKRPNSGVWGGLYSLPEFSDKNQLLLSGVDLDSLLEWPMVRHSFSHYHLELFPVEAKKHRAVEETAEAIYWMTPAQALSQGLPAPIKIIISKLALHL